MKKKHKNILKLLFLISISGTVVGIYYLNKTLSINQEKYNENTLKKLYTYKFSGSLSGLKELKSDKPLTYQELFSQLNIGLNADLSHFNLQEIAPFNTVIHIPSFKSETLKWSQIVSVKQILAFGVSKTLANKLMKLKKKWVFVPSWDDIISTAKFDFKEISILKSFLILI
ncbi:MAG0490 family ComEA-like DNA-binding protein [Mycoplasma hafezii]|uniref:MAG0490 family ComEA-like DNA-binding protein n=1 Tax=Mycoplasma hafezii TaxID=525886 RepID=UPI003CE978C7